MLLRNLSQIKNGASEIQISLKSSKKKYKKNEPIALEVEVSEKAYIYLILVQNDGEIVLLFPNEDSPDNLVSANTPIAIPEKNSGYVFSAGEPFGMDVLKVIASKRKIDLFTTEKIPGTPFSQIKESGEMVTKGIRRISTEMKPSDWNSAEIEVLTYE